MNGDLKLSKERAAEILANCHDRRLLVVGDLILDRYIHGEADRISPEAPVPVVRVVREHAVPGGSSNVALNVQALGGQAVLSGIVGDDAAGAQLKSLLHASGIAINGVVACGTRTTSVKTRVMAQRQQVVRVDREDTDSLPEACIRQILDRMDALLDTVHGVILEDYGKGVIDAPLVPYLIAGANRRGLPVGYDPKDNHDLDVRGVTVATPNRREAFLAARMNDSIEPPHPLEDPRLLEAGRRLLEAWEPRHLLLTLGAQGMLLLREGENPWHVPTLAREVFDVSGAGDTVIAVIMLALTAGASIEEAAALANACAGIVVGKLGTATASAEEVLALLENS